MAPVSPNPNERLGQPHPVRAPKPPARPGPNADESVGQKILLGTGIGAGVSFFILILVLVLLLVMFYRPTGSGPGGGGSAGTGGGAGGGSDGGEGAGAGAEAKPGRDSAPEPTRDMKSVGQGETGESESKATEPSPASAPVTPNEPIYSINRVEPSVPPQTARSGPPDAGSSGGGSDFDKRLKREGAKSGDVQISLLWNNYNDLDLHVQCPSGEVIFFRSRRSRCGGELDVDMNADGYDSDRPVENVYWPSGGAPKGLFRVFVNHFRNAGQRDPTEFKVAVKVDGRTKTFTGKVSYGNAAELVHTFNRR
jgi:hypothetical protein